MKNTTVVGLFAAVTMLIAGTAQAEDYPNRPIQLIVPFAAGGPSDITARAIAEDLGNELGQPVVVENRPGAGAIVGMQALLGAPSDGYTLMMGSNIITSAEYLYPDLPYDVLNDVQAVVAVSSSPIFALVPASSPADNLEEFIEIARSGELTYGSAGTGTLPQIALEMFKQQAGLEITHIPYRGSGQALPALVSEEVDLYFDIVFSAQGQVNAGTVKAIGVTSLDRIDQFPDVATFDEQGLEGFEAYSWFGIVARSDVPQEIVARLNEALNAVIVSEDFQELAASIGGTPLGGTPDEYWSMISEEHALWAEVIPAAGITLD